MISRTLVRAGVGAMLATLCLVSAPAVAQPDCGKSVVIDFGESIGDIARRCGTTVDAIMAANPLLPDPRFIFPGLRIKMPPPGPTTMSYVVRRGDTLLSVAQSFGIKLSDIYRLNPDIDAAKLKPGDVIRLPSGGLPPPPPPPQTVRYTVRPGDTLFSIARERNLPVADIYRLNPGIGARPLKPGDILLLPGRPVPPPPPPPVNTYNYVVRPGDTLFSIASANGTTVSQILKLNPDLDASRLRIGQVIRLQGGIVPPPQPQPNPPPAGIDADVSPGSGPVGAVVDVSASGFRPGATLRLLAGDRVSNLREFQQVTTDSRGNATIGVRIPDWAAGSGTLVFAFETPDGRLRAVSDTFRVTNTPPPPPPGTVRVTGTLTREGVECQAMRGDDGKLYTLTGRGLADFFPGDHVRVDGTVAQVSTCQQGTTIAVTRILPAQ